MQQIAGIWRVILAKKGFALAGLAVSRAFGDRELKQPQPLVTAQPEIATYQVDWEEDEGLVLATDGLWDVVQDADAAQIVLQHAAAGPEACSQALVAAAKARGSADDITAQVVLFGWRGHKMPQKAEEKEEEEDEEESEDVFAEDKEAQAKVSRAAEQADEKLAAEDRARAKMEEQAAASKNADAAVEAFAAASAEKALAMAKEQESDDEDEGVPLFTKANPEALAAAKDLNVFD